MARAFATWLACALAAVLTSVLTTGCGDAPTPAAQAPAESGASLRVVSLAPSLSEMVLALGAAEVLVGVDRYSAELAGMPEVRQLGDLFSPDLEGLAVLAPTLVLGVESTAHSGIFDWLRRQEVQVETFRLHTLEDVLAAFERVGVLLRRPERGRALAGRVRGELAEIAASVRGRPRPRVVILIQRDPLIVVGRGSFASDLLGFAGGENVFADLPDAYPRVSLEALAARHPDLLLETSALGPGAAEAVRAYWAGRPFIGRAAAIPRGEVVLPGAGLADAARILRAAIHPDLAVQSDLAIHPDLAVQSDVRADPDFRADPGGDPGVESVSGGTASSAPESEGAPRPEEGGTDRSGSAARQASE
jgi:iron complex transport system substrate-binding protein